MSTSAPFDPASYWEDRLSRRYTLGSTGWSSLGETFNRWAYAARGVVFKRFVRNAVGDAAGLRVLDVGSGTGFYLDQWRRLGVRDMTGSDLTSAAAERLRASFPEASIQQLDISDAEAELPAGTYDAISIMDVLYHVVDDERYRQALHNLARLLKPDGTLILTEHFVLRQQEGRHEVDRTKDQIDQMLLEAGLTPVRTRPVFFLMNTPVSSESRLLRLWWTLVCKLVKRHEAIGWLVGCAVFPAEALLGRILRDGPSTKIVACRRLV